MIFTTIRSTDEHNMGEMLITYINIKIHHILNSSKFGNVVILPKYDRTKIISTKEKHDKKFNWQRPTVEIKNDVCYICCFPGVEYVRHYASLISSYFALNKIETNVTCVLPKQRDIQIAINRLNFDEIPPAKCFILGYGLDNIFNGNQWNGKGPFKYLIPKIFSKDLIVLGCEFSLWGDIAGEIFRYLYEKKSCERLIYIGKLGCLNKYIQPNKYLAYGNQSFHNGKIITWQNAINIPKDDKIIKGIHCNSYSPIAETKKWVNENKKYDFVDPEIGYFGSVAQKIGLKFSYLHIISNNLSWNYQENLSNERIPKILKERRELLDKIYSILLLNFRG